LRLEKRYEMRELNIKLKKSKGLII